jgi:hypothetical protein
LPGREIPMNRYVIRDTPPGLDARIRLKTIVKGRTNENNLLSIDRKLLLFLICLPALFFFPISFFAQSPVTEGYQSSFRYLGGSATRASRNQIFREANGIANDSKYWYFASGDPADADTFLIRAPYYHHLDGSFDYIRKKVRPDPFNEGVCGHIGDIDVFVYEGHSYIIAPYERCTPDNNKGYIVIFDAEHFDLPGNMMYPLAYFDINIHTHGKAQSVAVKEDWDNPANTTIVLAARGYELHEYNVDWYKVINGGCLANESYSCFSLNRKIALENEQGERLEEVEFGSDHTRQGIDFSSDGSLCYVLIGYYKLDDVERKIHVFNTEGPSAGDTGWRRVKASTMEAPFGYMSEGRGQEPEGISWYDVNVIENYHKDMPRGELFAMNAWIAGRDEELTIKHYTTLNIPSFEDNSINHLFYNEWNGHGLWDGAIITLSTEKPYEQSVHLKASDLPSIITGDSKGIKIVPADGGRAIITGQ